MKVQNFNDQIKVGIKDQRDILNEIILDYPETKKKVILDYEEKKKQDEQNNPIKKMLKTINMKSGF